VDVNELIPLGDKCDFEIVELTKGMLETAFSINPIASTSKYLYHLQPSVSVFTQPVTIYKNVKIKDSNLAEERTDNNNLNNDNNDKDNNNNNNNNSNNNNNNNIGTEKFETTIERLECLMEVDIYVNITRGISIPPILPFLMNSQPSSNASSTQLLSLKKKNILYLTNQINLFPQVMDEPCDYNLSLRYSHLFNAFIRNEGNLELTNPKLCSNNIVLAYPTLCHIILSQVDINIKSRSNSKPLPSRIQFFATNSIDGTENMLTSKNTNNHSLFCLIDLKFKHRVSNEGQNDVAVAVIDDGSLYAIVTTKCYSNAILDMSDSTMGAKIAEISKGISFDPFSSVLRIFLANCVPCTQIIYLLFIILLLLLLLCTYYYALIIISLIVIMMMAMIIA
jgi:hypothetical protein